jgi:hypothetical protein
MVKKGKKNNVDPAAPGARRLASFASVRRQTRPVSAVKVLKGAQ